MRFILDIDYLTKIRQEVFSTVTDDNQVTIDKVMNESIDEVKSYLNGIYDTSKIFVDVKDYNALVAYLKGTLIYSGGKVYNTKIDTPAGTPLIDGTYYEVNDTRSPIIVRCVVDVMLYELHCLINVRSIPEFRIQRRDDAIKWLKAVADPRNNTIADLPLKEFETNSGADITWSSNDKINQYY